jgi:hypothetical protein
MNRLWRARVDKLYYPYYKKCVGILGGFSRETLEYRWIPREENEEADALSVQALLKIGVRVR